MSKRKPSNVTQVGDEDFNFDPRRKFAQKKIKQLNFDWDNKCNTSKIDLYSSVQMIFNEMHLYEQDVNIFREFNVQRLEILQMNRIFLEIKNS